MKLVFQVGPGMGRRKEQMIPEREKQTREWGPNLSHHARTCLRGAPHPQTAIMATNNEELYGVEWDCQESDCCIPSPWYLKASAAAKKCPFTAAESRAVGPELSVSGWLFTTPHSLQSGFFIHYLKLDCDLAPCVVSEEVKELGWGVSLFASIKGKGNKAPVTVRVRAFLFPVVAILDNYSPALLCTGRYGI